MTRRSRSRLEPAEWYSHPAGAEPEAGDVPCPLCGYQLHAMSDHVLIAPEGDTSRRRHAHLECVAAANLPGRPARPGLLARLLGRD